MNNFVPSKGDEWTALGNQGCSLINSNWWTNFNNQRPKVTTLDNQVVHWSGVTIKGKEWQMKDSGPSKTRVRNEQLWTKKRSHSPSSLKMAGLECFVNQMNKKSKHTHTQNGVHAAGICTVKSQWQRKNKKQTKLPSLKVAELYHCYEPENCLHSTELAFPTKYNRDSPPTRIFQLGQ